MSDLKLQGLGKRYGKVTVLKDVDLHVNQGEFVVFVGPSGCGKSTLLRMIAGLEEISAGELLIDGNRINETPPSMRGIAMVFQSYALYPHMSVYDNMAFSLQVAKLGKKEIDTSVRAAAEKLQLTPLLNRLPKELSGGQRQRVAIGRAIVRNPKIFLFDEPLSNLDAALRVATRIEIANLKESMPETTMIYVTHDQVEAMTLADRIVVLSAGKIEQVGSPMTLYKKPGNLFVAKFIGSPAMNVVQVADNVDYLLLPDGSNISHPDQKGRKRIKYMGVRPEHLRVGNSENNLLTGVVSFVENLGEVTLVYIECECSEEPIVAKLQGSKEFIKGEAISLSAEMKRLHYFDSEGINIAK